MFQLFMYYSAPTISSGYSLKTLYMKTKNPVPGTQQVQISINSTVGRTSSSGD